MNRITALITGAIATFGSTELTDSFSLIDSSNYINSYLLSQQSYSTWDYVLKIILSLIGGIASTILLAYLKKMFPRQFAESRRKRMYKRK